MLKRAVTARPIEFALGGTFGYKQILGNLCSLSLLPVPTIGKIYDGALFRGL